MLKACGFDLLFINLEEHEHIESDIDRIRETGYKNPIVGLVSRRSLDRADFLRPSGIDELLCKEDLSPSLVEHGIRSILARHALTSERSLLESRLNLALEAGELGSWTYYPKRREFELDAIAQAMLAIQPGTSTRSFDEIAGAIYAEDKSAFEETIDRLPLPKEIVECQFRMNGEHVPLPCLQLRGRIWQSASSEETSIMGVLRQVPKTNELFDRITEANDAVQEAFQAREEALQKANRKLQALASELGHSDLVSPSAPEEPSKGASEQPLKQLPGPMPVAEAAHENEQDLDPQDAPVEVSAEAEATAPETEPATSGNNTENEENSESLAIDKQAAYEEVLKTVARQKSAEPTQEPFPFDFAQEPIADYSPPNPAKEGFIGAAKRLVALTRKEHGIEASISIADQQSIELEERRDLLFDILRELLANVVKHSEAKLCIITLFRDEDEWVLQVEDDGIGLDDTLKSVNAPLNKIGLFQIRTQLALKGGHLDMVPASPNGLIARVRLPVSIRDGAKSS